MAVVSMAEVTVIDVTDAESVVCWWQWSNSATAPSAPVTTQTSQTPTDWQSNEPTITTDADAAGYVYACWQTNWGDGSCEWGDVSRSASFEAAKRAWNKAGSVQSDLNATRSWYAYCETPAATAGKVATIDPVTDAFELRVGVIVNVTFSNTNSAAVANLTLDVNDTGAKGIKYMYNNTRSNLPAVGYLVAGIVYQIMYDGTYWTIQNLHYNTNSTYNQGVNQFYNTIKAKAAITAESIIVGDASGYASADAGVTFDLGYQILWSTVALSVNGTNYAKLYTTHYDRNLATSHGFSGGTANSTVYLVGTVAGNTVTLANAYLTTTTPTAETSPVTVYIPIGRLGNQSTGANYFYFISTDRPTLYAYLDGEFRQVTPTEVVGTQYIYKQMSGGSTTTEAPSLWVTEAGESVDMEVENPTPVWTTKPPTYRSEFPVTFVARQTKRLDGTITCTTPAIDDTTTIIDGGNIITGSVTANKLSAESINASGMLTIGALDEDTSGRIDSTEALVSSALSNIDSISTDLYGGEDEEGNEIPSRLVTLENATTNLGETIEQQEADLREAIEEAAKTATNYLVYNATTGELILGESGAESLVRNVITNTRQSYRTDAGDIAWFGLNGDEWQLFIETAAVEDRLKFGDFAWIKRDNGNMTLKWTGASS